MRLLLVRIGTFIGLGLAGLVLASSVATGQTPRPDLQAQAQALLEAAPEQLDIEPGQVLYVRKEFYDRHGPKADEIGEVRNLTTERSVRETWYEVGFDRQVVRSASRLIDANGVVVQVDIGQDGTLQSIDPRTNEVLVELDQLQFPIDNLTQVADAYANLIATGNMEVTSISGAQITAKIESALPQVEDGAWQRRDSFQVPFFLDLGAESSVTWRVLTADDGLERGFEHYAVTASGERTLISSKTVSGVDVVEAIPSDMLSVKATGQEAEVEAELFARTCTNPTPRECFETIPNELSGVDLEVQAVTFLWQIGYTDGVYSYQGAGYSDADIAVNYISIVGSGGHDCMGEIETNTWYFPDSRYNTNHAWLYDGTQTAAQEHETLCLPWRSWTSGSHSISDSSFGWSPSTQPLVRCTTVYCS